MAQKQTVEYVDDFDGKVITDNDAPTVQFSLDGTDYEIDLSDSNQTKLRDALAPYMLAGKKVGSSRGKSKAKPVQSGPSAKELREWAKSNGFDVPDRGRIPAEVREAFDKAS